MSKEFRDLPFQGRKRRFQGRPAGVDDNRPIWVQLRKVQTHGFTEAALDQVADVGTSQCPRGGKTDACAFCFVLPQIKGSEMSTRVALACVVDKSEIAGS
jgi:hypothetical protein